MAYSELVEGEVIPQSQMSFGEVLHSLLGDISVLSLAQAIHTDRGVIYRWLRNERVPQLNTDHVVNIATFLQLDPRAIDRLKQAQITSLSRDPVARPSTHRASSGRVAAVNRFIQYAQRPPEPLQLQDHAPRPFLPASTAKPFKAMTLRGARQVIQAAVSLLEQIPSASSHSDGLAPTILVSMQGEDLFSGPASTRTLEIAWRLALRGALERGWQIEQLWRLNWDVDRSLRAVESVLDLFELGGYFPRYFERYGLLHSPYDMIIVPGHAALLSFAVDNALRVDGAVLMTDPAQIDLMSAHFHQMCDSTRPLLQTFLPQRQEMAYTEALVAAEGRPGGRRLVKDGLSALTHPLAWLDDGSLFSQHLQRADMVSKQDVKRYFELLRQRFAQFEILVQQYEYLDICTQRAIHLLVEQGQYHADIPLYGIPVPLEQRLEHLRNLIHMLQSYPHYQLSLLDEHEGERLPIEPTRIIAGDSTVFVSTNTHGQINTPTMIDVQMTEPTIVRAFQEHFTGMWDRIAPQHYHKADVIHWLEQQAEQLQRRM